MKEYNAWVICLRTGVIKLIMKREKNSNFQMIGLNLYLIQIHLQKNTYMYCNYSTKVRKQITQ